MADLNTSLQRDDMGVNQKALIKMMRSDAELFEGSDVQHTNSDRVLIDDGIDLKKFNVPSDGNFDAANDEELKDFVKKKVAKKTHARKYMTSFQNTSMNSTSVPR